MLALPLHYLHAQYRRLQGLLGTQRVVCLHTVEEVLHVRYIQGSKLG